VSKLNNPLDTIRKFQSRLGKPIRPIIEIQKEGSITSILTNTIQTENMIQDQYRNEAWQLDSNCKCTALYIDGVFKGIGYYAHEKGTTIDIKVNVEAYSEEIEELLEGEKRIIYKGTLHANYKGLLSKLLDASLLERASALKPSLMEKLIFCGIGILIGVLMGMSYA